MCGAIEWPLEGSDLQVHGITCIAHIFYNYLCEMNALFIAVMSEVKSTVNYYGRFNQ